MNLYLHGIDANIAIGDTIYAAPGRRDFDVILTNPPFGTRGANQAPDRDDFTVSTSNKQLNFLQHILTGLRPGGRAAVVLPDNCLFADQAGEVFKILCEDCDLHTVLRLPRGTFTPYSQGVKANVVFFTKGTPAETVWIYDARTNVPGITKKDGPLTREHVAEFEKCFGADPNGRSKRKPEHSREDCRRSSGIDEVKAREFKLDGFKWLEQFRERCSATVRVRVRRRNHFLEPPMRAYSMDLRERVWADCRAGMKTPGVPRKYSVSASWVRRLKQRQKATGSIAPRPPRPGRPVALAPHDARAGTGPRRPGRDPGRVASAIGAEDQHLGPVRVPAVDPIVL